MSGEAVEPAGDAASLPAPSPAAPRLRRLGLADSIEPTADRFPRLSRLLAGAASLRGSGELAARCGTVQSVRQNTLIVDGLSKWSNLGDLLRVGDGDEAWFAQIIAANPDTVVAKPMTTAIRVKVGDEVELIGPIKLFPSQGWKGRILDAFGRPLDGGGPVPAGHHRLDPYGPPPEAMKRERIVERAITGVHAIDLFVPVCHGQRIGIFGGSGTGKSSLLSLLANTRGFDTIVIGLIGERGREVREFVEDKLGQGHRNATVIASTGDEAPSVRMLAANTAMLAAEYFRDRGERVLLIIDSVTRFAHAVREVGLAAGEMPVVRGHTTLLYSSLSQLLERAGPSEGGGMITGIFSVLVDGDDHNEPVADAVRGILDGHIVLDRAIAATGRFPAINIPMSLSRLSDVALDREQTALVRQARRLIATFEQADEMRRLGGYVEGADQYVDMALKLVPQIYDYLTQDVQSLEQAGYDPFARLAAFLAQANSQPPAGAGRPAEARREGQAVPLQAQG
ncbi:MAG: flagellum-specific ATP synthase [Alphaproteobacteria bacterium]|nr:MAG: flagellum-specific ATP synthase [Alphaproteobacteria bacterium]